MLDVIKEYLVDIGFNVNNQSLNKAKGSLNEAERAMNKFTTSTGSKLVGAGAAVATFITTIDLAVGHMLGGLAKTDLEMQMFARMMWTSKENAQAFKNTLDAMGVSMQDLYVSPELMQKFVELRNESLTLGPPKEEYEKQMRSVREFGYEFARLKASLTYAFQWIGYYLMKYLEKPITKLRDWFTKLNNDIITNMPKWTKYVAQVTSWFVRLTDTLLSLPDAIKLLIVAMTGWKTTLALIKSPLTWMIAGITALLLLMEDYNTYQRGGDSLFGDIWEKFSDGDIQKSFEGMSKSLKSIVDTIMDLAKNVDWDNLISDTLLISVQALERSLKFIAGYLQSISDLLKGDMKGTLVGLSNAGSGLFGADPVDPNDVSWASGSEIWDRLTNFDKYAESFKSFYGIGGKSNTTTNNTTQTNNFNIQSTDPTGTANEVQRVLRSQQGGY